MAKVKIKQFKNKAKEPVAGLTPEHAIYDANGVRLDAKLGNVNLQEFRDLQQQGVNAIKNQQNASETYINNKVSSAKAEIDAKHEEIAQLTQASMVGSNATSLEGSNVEEKLTSAGGKLTELEENLNKLNDGYKYVYNTTDVTLEPVVGRTPTDYNDFVKVVHIETNGYEFTDIKCLAFYCTDSLIQANINNGRYGATVARASIQKSNFKDEDWKYFFSEIEGSGVTGYIIFNTAKLYNLSKYGSGTLDTLFSYERDGKAFTAPVSESLNEKFNNKQDKLVFDTKPTQNSNNSVKSGAIYDFVTDEIEEREQPLSTNGIKILAKSFKNGTLNPDGEYAGDDNMSICCELPILVQPATKYIIANNAGYKYYVAFFDIDGVIISHKWYDVREDFTTTAATYYIKVGVRNTSSNALRVDSFDSVVIQCIDKTTTDSIDLLPLRKVIDDYWFNLPSSITSGNSDEYIEGKIKSIRGNNPFIFFTDCHWIDSQRKSIPIVDYVKGRNSINNVVFGGDVIGNSKGASESLAWAKKFMNEVNCSFGKDMMFVMGNHDLNTHTASAADNWGYKDCADIYNSNSLKLVYDTRIVNKAKELGYSGNDLAEIEAFNKMHYYYDDVVNKVRYIVVDTGCSTDNSFMGTLGFGQFSMLALQFDFVNDALMSLKDRYSVVVCMHIGIGWTTNFQVTEYNTTCLAQMLCSFKAKRNISFICDRGTEAAKDLYANGRYVDTSASKKQIRFTFDYSSAPSESKIFVMCGDTHADSSCIYQKGSSSYHSESYVDGMTIESDAILFINTACENIGRIAKESDLKGNATIPEVAPNSINETLFDVIHWDNNHVYATRIGAGLDRVFNY